ncbi:MAG: HD domain-containing protein [Calditrichaceae bacterium]
MQEIENVLKFIIEIEKLKDIHRKTKPVGLDRYENSAEHSWHVCISALMLKDFANDAIDINHVIKMLLIHDLGEIDGGDKIIYQSESIEQKSKEAAGVERILSFLNPAKRREYMDLWYEFEAGETPESKFARAVDRVPPLLHNLHSDGYTWKKHNITKEQVFDINSRIDEGSHALWQSIKLKLQKAVKKGILK